MTTDHDIAPAPRYSAGFWTLLRIAGIIVGVATLLRLATIGFGVQFNDVFQAFLDRMRALFELDAVVDVIQAYIVDPALEWLRSFNLAIPELAPHWRQIFALNWLMMVTTTRYWKKNPAVLSVWACICALVAGVLIGLVSIAGAAVLPIQLAVFGLFVTGVALSDARDMVTALLVSIAFSIAAAVISYGAIGLSEGYFELDLASAGIFGWAVFVASYGLLFFAISLTSEDPTDTIAFDIGSGILSVMGVAIGIGYLMMK